MPMMQQPIIGNAAVTAPGRSNAKGRRGGNFNGTAQTPPPPPPTPQQSWTRVKSKWRCGFKDCQSGLNNAENLDCYKCARPKNVAMSPPPALARPKPADPPAPPPPTVPNPSTGNAKEERRQRKNLKRKEKRAAKQSDGTAQKPAAAAAPAAAATPPLMRKPADVPMVDSDSDCEDENLPDLAKDELALLKSLGLQPILTASTLETTFSKPKAKETANSPEEDVSAACGTNDALAEAMTNVTFYQSELAAIEADPSKALMVPVLQKALKDAEEKVTTLSQSNKTISLVSLQAKRGRAKQNFDASFVQAWR